MSSAKAFSRLIIIGDSGVGKTCLLDGLLGQVFSPVHMATTAADFRTLQFRHRGCAVGLQLWDTAGQEAYRSLSRLYVRGAQVVLLCFAIPARDSFESLDEWRAMVADEVPAARVILVATKEDLAGDPQRPWSVAADEGAAKAAQYGVPFVATSARTRNGIESLTVLIGDAVLDVAEAPTDAAPSGAVANIGGARAMDGKCC
jgi:Ras-related protein Rab-2A